jgi:hypothetical protein
MKKVYSADELWAHLDSLGGDRHRFLVEQFKPGDVYHVDALSEHGKIVFERASVYLSTPFEVAHGGGIFRSAIVPFGSADEKQLLALNTKVMNAFGMQTSASHTEYIKNKETGEFYFLETASRVGGAHLADMWMLHRALTCGTNGRVWKQRWLPVKNTSCRNHAKIMRASLFLLLDRNRRIPNNFRTRKFAVAWRAKPTILALLYARPHWSGFWSC